MPPWCHLREGSSDVLLIAPHGGIGSDDLLLGAGAISRRGNDLHTADLARSIGERLDASWLVNPTIDRNELDLNRVKDVLARAPWFVAAIEHLLGRILEAHPEAIVLVLHGWHVGQPRCDLGIGASLSGAEVDEGSAGSLTVGREFLAGPLERFRRGLEQRGVIATYGERWPAAHVNNAMRFFRRRDAGCASGALARWVGEGRVQAVQLELGAPLRWPGAPRERLVEWTVEAFRHDGAAGGGDRALAAGEPYGLANDSSSAGARFVAETATALVLRAFDVRGGPDALAVVAGATRFPNGDVGTRLLLFPGGSRMAIFTGHGRGDSLAVPGFRFERTARGFRFRFDGHVLVVDDGALYFRDESAQAAASLAPAHLDLTLRQVAPDFGVVRGTVRLDGEERTILAGGFVDAGRGIGRSQAGVRLSATLGPGRALRVEIRASETGLETGDLEVVQLGRSGFEPMPAARARRDEETGGLDLDLGDGRVLRACVRSRVALLRPAGRSAVHLTLGPAWIESDGETAGAAFYEEARLV